MPITFDPFTGPGSTPARRRFWYDAISAVHASRKLPSTNVKVDEYSSGSVISIPDSRSKTPPSVRTGACCTDGACTITTEEECAGHYLGNDTTCEGVTCPPTGSGACCHTDGTCTIETAETCDGVYQGDDVPCEGVDCTNGACCVDGVCGITTEAECTGIFLGNGSTCGAITCACACGFNAFDGSGRKFLHYRRVITGSVNRSEAGECDNDPSATFTIEYTSTGAATLVQHYDPDCTLVTDTNDSASSHTETINGVVTDSCIRADLQCFCNIDVPVPPDACVTLIDACQSCGGGDSNSDTTDSTATTRVRTIIFTQSCVNDFYCVGGSSHGNAHCTSNASYVATETLSNECLPA